VKNFQKENKVEVYECSAKLGTNINEPFEYLIKEILKNKRKKEGDQIIINKSSSCHC
jgi:hypothetical protein